MSDTSEQEEKRDEGETREPEEIRADIKQTREELGETAAAVAEKTDVKRQATAKASAKAEEVRGKVREVTDQAAVKAREAAPESAAPAIENAQRFANERPLVVVGAALATVVVLGRLLSR
jgi:ElaB/YqjD/DUF883 family membrane-anchored ribosome-binding protein